MVNSGLVIVILFLLIVLQVAYPYSNVTKQGCMEMFFGDNSTEGYVEELANQCWKLLK
jgi:hypothetical protein